MKKLLHIVATPRGDASRTLKISNAFLEAFRRAHEKCEIDDLDITGGKLPELTRLRVDGKYALMSGGELKGEYEKAWEEITAHIERFLSADAYLLSVPMWNFSVPYFLKHYIDVIVQPGHLFTYTDKGPEGLVENRKMAVITSRGGDYSAKSPFNAYDNQEPYLRAVFGFVGIKDITFINAQPMDSGVPGIRERKIEEAKRLAVRLAESF